MSETIEGLHGVPTSVVRDRFWRRVDVGFSDDCWPWKGERVWNGYGAVRVQGKRGPRVVAHRVAYMLTNGSIPDGMKVCHRCDNRACVNPSHLFLGTQAENLADMRAKGRDFPPPRMVGQRNPGAKLTADQVASIRVAIAGGAVQRHLAAEYGVSPSAINLIARGKKWAMAA